jgi:hypothetical protein
MAVIFRENKEEGKAVSSIDIINKSSESHILFKVKTTEPNNYIVRPNQGVIRPESSVNVKIICQVNLTQVCVSCLMSHDFRMRIRYLMTNFWFNSQRRSLLPLIFR